MGHVLNQVILNIFFYLQYSWVTNAINLSFSETYTYYQVDFQVTQHHKASR